MGDEECEVGLDGAGDGCTLGGAGFEGAMLSEIVCCGPTCVAGRAKGLPGTNSNAFALSLLIVRRDQRRFHPLLSRPIS